MDNIPQHQIRAKFNGQTVRVYQAYGDDIADAALAHGTFVSPPFKMERMTWIKPSFLWMMYRAGWGFKDDGQRRLLAVDISREGFEWALRHGSLTRPIASMPRSDWLSLKRKLPVRIQWDPERDLYLQPLPYRTIQIGLSSEAIFLYVSKWIQNITDITDFAHTIYNLVARGELDEATSKLPVEHPYPYTLVELFK
jgi:hypothetical protein